MDHMEPSTKLHDYAQPFIFKLILHYVSVKMSHTLCFSYGNVYLLFDCNLHKDKSLIQVSKMFVNKNFTKETLQGRH